MFEQDNDKPDSGRWIKAVAVAATAVAVASLAIVGTVAAQTRQTFNDVPRSHYAYEAVEWAYANRITEGCDNRFNFCPDKPLSRAHMVTFLKRYHDTFGGTSVPPATTTTAATPSEWVLRGYGSTEDSATLPAGQYYVEFTLVRSTTSLIEKVEVTVAGPAISSKQEIIEIEPEDDSNTNFTSDETTLRDRGTFSVGSRLSQLPPGRIYFEVQVTGTKGVATTDWEIVVTER